MKIGVLVDLFFTELPLEQRVEKIAGCGYRYVETWAGGDASALKAIADAGKRCGVELYSIVMNSAGREDTAPIRAENRTRFMEQVDRYSDHALAAGCRQGIVTAGQAVRGLDYQTQRAALVDALHAAGEKIASKGFILNLEPLNTEIDHPGYFLASPREAVAIVKEAGLDNVRLLFDLYHMGIMTGNLTAFIERNIKWIGHFHAAGIPGRHEPSEGETNYPFLIKKLEQAGYKGFLGVEYYPMLPSSESLRQTLAYLS